MINLSFNFLQLDPRIWNSIDAIDANVPAAGGRFSAAALAHFYKDLERLLGPECFAIASRVQAVELPSSTRLLQGANTIAGNPNSGGRFERGIGYQLIRTDLDGDGPPSCVGHAGVGGSIGFHHKASGISVGLMLNKADGGEAVTQRILKVVADHIKI